MGRPDRNPATQQQQSTQRAATSRRLLRSSSSSQRGVVAGVATAVALLAAAVILLLILLLRRRAREARRRRTSPAEGTPPLKRFSYRQLKRATGGFSEASKVGQGGFGSVFRATLPGGRVVAVKRLDTASLQSERDFANELSIVGRLMGTATPSNNLVALLGYCDSKRKMLVYEYMENRSLQEALFGGEEAATGRRRTGLEWGKRVGILLDVARALAFLHKCDPVVIHGDVKPSNVLLDAGYGAKLADFGLARFKLGCDGDIEEEEAAITVVVDDTRRVRQKGRSSRRWKSRADSVPAAAAAAAAGDSDQQQQSDEPGVAEDEPSGGEAQPSPSQQQQQQSSQPVSLSQSPVATSEVAAAAAEDDDWMSKASGYEGTEPDTWSKLSPSEVDWRSEVSLDSGGRRGSRRYFWRKSKKNSAGMGVQMPPGDWWPDNVANTTNNSSGGGIKGYLVDWVSCERGRSRARDRPATKDGKQKKQARSGSLEWWAECEDSGDSGELMRRIKSEQKRKQQQQRHQQQESFSMPMSRESSREWWRPNNVGRSASEESFTFYQHNQQQQYHHSGEIPFSNGSDTMAAAAIVASDGGRRRVRTRSREWWSGEMQRGREWWSGELGRRTAAKFLADSHSGELSKSKRRQRRRSSQEWWSGELGTTMSSTPSMRGTVCYVAPEQGGGAGGAMATEKVDVYSFGVLCLVVVSGRRPLQVVATPMSEFERANLVSWARAAARAGRPLDIVDPALKGELDESQATGIVSLALQCLQRSPHLRPSMSDAVRVLAGEAEPPPLPLEFSPSPPTKASSSSAKRKNNEVPSVETAAAPG